MCNTIGIKCKHRSSETSDVNDTHIRLEHVVVLLLGAEGLLQDGDVTLVVVVLLLQRLHLGGQRHNLLISPLDLGPRVIKLGTFRGREMVSESLLVRQQTGDIQRREGL